MRSKIDDDAVLSALRSAMQGHADDVPPTPGPAHIRAGLRRVGRRRRLRGAAAVAAGTLAVAGLAGALLTALPEHRTAPPAARLIDRPPRGSLARDTAFLTGVQQKVTSWKTLTVGGVAYRAPAAGAVRVLYAGDVQGYRLALVWGPWARGPAGRPGLEFWLVGRAGAPAAQLFQGAVAPGAPDVAVQEIQPGSLPGSDRTMKRRGIAVAVTAADERGEDDARFAGPPRYARDTRVTMPLGDRADEPEPGVFTAALLADGYHRLAVGGAWPTGWGLLDSPPSDAIDYGIPALYPDLKYPGATRLSAAPAGAAMNEIRQSAVAYSGFRSGDLSMITFALEPRRSSTGEITSWVGVVGVFNEPRGGMLVGAQEVASRPRRTSLDRPHLDAWTIARAGGDPPALAWITSRIVGQGADREVGAAVGARPQVFVIGPERARTAELVSRSGGVLESVAVSAGRIAKIGAGAGADLANSQVRLRDRTGRVIATTTVQGTGNVQRPPTPYRSWTPAAR